MSVLRFFFSGMVSSFVGSTGVSPVSCTLSEFRLRVRRITGSSSHFFKTILHCLCKTVRCSEAVSRPLFRFFGLSSSSVAGFVRLPVRFEFFELLSCTSASSSDSSSPSEAYFLRLLFLLFELLAGLLLVAFKVEIFNLILSAL